MRKILIELRIVARDQNKVFFELASMRRPSPADVEDRYDLEPGKGNACVEFDVEPGNVQSQYNPRIRLDELFVVGNVDLASRNPVGFLNA